MDELTVVLCPCVPLPQALEREWPRAVLTVDKVAAARAQEVSTVHVMDRVRTELLCPPHDAKNSA